MVDIYRPQRPLFEITGVPSVSDIMERARETLGQASSPWAINGTIDGGPFIGQIGINIDLDSYRQRAIGVVSKTVENAVAGAVRNLFGGTSPQSTAPASGPVSSADLLKSISGKLETLQTGGKPRGQGNPAPTDGRADGGEESNGATVSDLLNGGPSRASRENDPETWAARDSAIWGAVGQRLAFGLLGLFLVSIGAVFILLPAARRVLPDAESLVDIFAKLRAADALKGGKLKIADNGGDKKDPPILTADTKPNNDTPGIIDYDAEREPRAPRYFQTDGPGVNSFLGPQKRVAFGRSKKDSDKEAKQDADAEARRDKKQRDKTKKEKGGEGKPISDADVTYGGTWSKMLDDAEKKDKKDNE